MSRGSITALVAHSLSGSSVVYHADLTLSRFNLGRKVGHANRLHDANPAKHRVADLLQTSWISTRLPQAFA